MEKITESVQLKAGQEMCQHVKVWNFFVLVIAFFHYLLNSVVDCKFVDPPFDGALTYVNGTSTYLSMIIASCSARYGITGSEVRVCLADGFWSGVEARCLGI